MKSDSSRRSYSLLRRWIRRIFLTLFALLLLAACGLAWWLWGWRIGGLSFHESWAPTQREELQAMADDILHFADKSILQENNNLPSDYTPPLMKSLKLQMQLRPMQAHTYAELKRTAAEGKAPEHDETGFPMTYLAARMGKLALARELVSRGDDPNKAAYFSVSNYRESSFQAAIACVPFFNGEAPPVAERTALLEHMLAHGAQLTIPQPEDGPEEIYVTLALSLISVMRGDGGATCEWLLEHGYELRTQKDRQLVSMALSLGEGTLPTIRRIVSKYYGEPDATDRYYMLHAAICSLPDAPLKLRWALEELHADPNASLTETDEAGQPCTKLSAMHDFCSTHLLSITNAVDSESDGAALSPYRLLDMLDLLLTHGGVLERPADYMPTSPALRQAYIEVLKKHGISCQENDAGTARAE